jgi:hypothetical protein
MKLNDLRDLKKSDDSISPAPAGIERVIHIEFQRAEETHRATLTSRIMDMSSKIRRDRACALLADGVRFDDLPVTGQLRIFALATIAQMIEVLPPWLEFWMGRYDVLLFKVYEEVDAHERAFFRGNMGESAEGEGEPSVTIRAVDVEF